jgi:hypothetical protein
MISNTIIKPAEVTGADPDNRTVAIKWYGLPSGVQKVLVVSDTGDFSFPKVGDIGLVIQHSAQAYYLGKIEYGYKNKIAGKVFDTETESKVLAKRVQEGEVYIGNLLKRVWLSMSSAGDFSLLNGFNEGLRYYLRGRILKLAGMVTQIVGNGVTYKLGSVMRDAVVKKNVIAQEVPLVPAIEACLELLFQQVKIVRFHLGHIKSRVTDVGVGIDEFSTFGGRLRAILEVAAGPVTIAALKMDELGNIELTSSLAGKISIDTTAVKSILFGGLAAVHRALLGEPFLAHYKAHTHFTPVGPSGTMVVPLVDETVLSQKVKLI